MSAESVFKGLYGNERLKSYLSYSVIEKKLPHALIFEGVEGSGKQTAALLTLSAMEPSFADKIMKYGSPDVTLHTVPEGKKSIGVSSVRDIKYQAYIKPQELSFRAFIIDKAETMTAEAQNALLKIFEEPPANVFFFLLCDNASSLLSTVRSRAPMLRMEAFDNATLSDYLLGSNEKARKLYEKDVEAFTLLIRSSLGAIGEAERRLGETEDSAYVVKEKTDELIKLLSEGKSAEILCFFSSLKTSREELSLILLNLMTGIRDMLSVKYGTNGEQLYFSSSEKAEDIAASFARQTLINLYHTAKELMETVSEINVNVQLFALKSASALTDALK